MSKQIAVLMLKTDSDPVYYNVSTSEKMDKACREILSERQEEGLYECGDPPTIEEVQDRRYSGSVESIAKQQQAELENEMSGWRTQKQFRDRVVAYLASDPNPNNLEPNATIFCHSPQRYHVGYRLLLERSDAPHEGVELIRPWEVI